MKIFVILHATLVLNKLAVTLGPVKVMGAGVALKPFVKEVSSVQVLYMLVCVHMFVIIFNCNYYSAVSVMETILIVF